MSPNRWLHQLGARPLNPLQSANESLTEDLLHAAKRSRRPNAEAIGASQRVTTSSRQERHRGAIGAGMLGRGPRHSRSVPLCGDQALCLAPTIASPWPEDSRDHGDELEQPPSSDKHGSKWNSHQEPQPEVLSALGSPGGNNFARWGMREALSGGLERDARRQRAGQPPYLYWVTAGLALAEQWNLTVLSSRTGCGSTDKFTRGGSAKRQRQARERAEDVAQHPLARCLPGFSAPKAKLGREKTWQKPCDSLTL